MSESGDQSVSVLIVSTQPAEMAPIAKFLSKRGFRIEIKDNVKDAMVTVGHVQPDWVFLSVNVAPSVERCTELLRSTFKVDPIYFADVLDPKILNFLNSHKGSITGRLTGPLVQMKLAQIVSEKKVLRGGQPNKVKVGVRPSSFLHVKGAAETEPSVHVDGDEGESDFAGKFVRDVKQVSVMTIESGSMKGYLVIGNTMQGEEGRAEIVKLRDRIVAEFTGGAPAQGLFIGSIDMDIADFPRWATLRSTKVRRIPLGEDEVMTCFIPQDRPLPEVKDIATDSSKIEVSFKDIPVEKHLPCPMYVHLPQNNKFVCLIKAQGFLSAKQQERLSGLGVPGLVIAKADIEIFKMFYVREKLTAEALEETLSA